LIKYYKSYLINGRPLKSINQFFNKERSKIQSELKITNDREWSNRLAKLQLKRNNKINDYMHKASKLVVDLLLENNVGKIVIGKNKDWKTFSKMSKKNNQNFISIPHAKFINILTYKCDNVGIEVILTEESYTSKVDHLSNEKLCKHKKYSGKRVNRGLFKSFSGKLLNADINGSIGMLRKKNVVSDIDLINLGYRGDVVSPIKLICK
jgi:putative transposase